MLEGTTFRCKNAAAAVGWGTLAVGAGVVGIALPPLDISARMHAIWTNKPMTVSDYYFHKKKTQKTIFKMSADCLSFAGRCYDRSKDNLAAVYNGPKVPSSFYHRMVKMVGLS